jgi:hypothetical protein
MASLPRTDWGDFDVGRGTPSASCPDKVQIVVHDGWPDAVFVHEADAFAYIEQQSADECTRAEKAERPPKTVPYYICELPLRSAPSNCEEQS